MISVVRPRRSRAEAVAMLCDVAVIPVIRADSAAAAVHVVEALADAGLHVAEITMTVPGALGAIARVARQFAGGVLVGAGTVTDAADVRRAVDSGAEFIVSPSFIPDVVAASGAANVAVIAGALTPTEVQHAVQAGADFVKIFPAEAVGGASYIRALRGPFPTVRFVPTGGVNLQTVGDYLRAGSAAVGVGGELVVRDAIERGDYSAIRLLATQFMQAVVVARRVMQAVAASRGG
jgi:2-dehydro-3-deoxyphosphogluconate aldolase/(4S)-4-hydroxy-2-oxoglutarate aldolase